MRYVLHHFTKNKDGKEPTNTSIGEFVITQIADEKFELVFVYTHNSYTREEKWDLPTRGEADEKIRTHLKRYFKSWEEIDPMNTT